MELKKPLRPTAGRCRLHGNALLATERLLAGDIWSSVDYYNRWKALHYFVRDAYKDILISFEGNERLRFTLFPTYKKIFMRAKFKNY